MGGRRLGLGPIVRALGGRRRGDPTPDDPAPVVLVPVGGPPARATVRRAVAEAGDGTVAVVALLRIHGSAWGFPNPGLLPNATEKAEARRVVEATIAAVERHGGRADGQITATRHAAKVVVAAARRRQARLVIVERPPAGRVRTRHRGRPRRRRPPPSPEPARGGRRGRRPRRLDLGGPPPTCARAQQVSDGPAVVIVGAGVEGLSTARAFVERGVRDVTVVDRGDIAGGMTSLSAGIVRCHYGVPSLAAMAWRSLPVLAGATEILGDPSGFHPTGYLVGVGTGDVAALEANVAMQRGLGIDVDLIGHDRAAELWPGAELDDFGAFAYEPRGGYGDGYQTAQAFATAARRGGARVRQRSPVASITTGGDGVTGVVLADGSRLGADVVVVAAGPWSRALVAPARGRPPPPGATGPDPHRRPGGGNGPGPGPVRSRLPAVRPARRPGVPARR